MKSGAWKLLVLFVLAAAGSATLVGRPGAAQADEPWAHVHPWRLDCRFLGDDKNKGVSEQCEAAVDLCRFDHDAIDNCVDVMRVSCGGRMIFEGLANHDVAHGLQLVSARNDAGLPRVRYEAEDTDLKDFVVSAWLDQDWGAAEGFCRVHKNDRY